MLLLASGRETWRNCDGDNGGGGHPTNILGGAAVAFGFLEVACEGYGHFLEFLAEFNDCGFIPGVDIELGGSG